MRVFFYIVGSLVFFGCGQNDLYRSTLRSADSLTGAVNYVMKDLEMPDSNEIRNYRRISRYYTQFVVQNINDTVEKSHGDALRLFMSAGKELEFFESNRKKILERSAQLNTQLDKLSHDLEQRSVSAEQGKVFFENEKKAADELVQHAQTSKKNLVTAVQNYKSSVRIVEQMIRSRNHGNLPTIVNDSIVVN